MELSDLCDFVLGDDPPAVCPLRGAVSLGETEVTPYYKEALEQIKEARQLWESRTWTQREIASRFRVSAATMNRAIRQLAREERNV